MKHVIHKLFWAWEFEKEEKWLNEMSAKGLRLSDVSFGRYVFEEGLPGEYVYRLEMLAHMPQHPESAQYIRFIEETGAEHIGSLKRWVYFRKKAETGGFDLFSDIESRVRHLNRILLLIGVLACMNLINSANQMFVWISVQMPLNLIVSLICLALEILLVYGFIRLYIQKAKLKKEKTLHE